MRIEGDLGCHQTASSGGQAVCTLAAPTSFLMMSSCGDTKDHDAPSSAGSILIGGPIQENPETCALANAFTYIDPDDPPFRIFHGNSDHKVPHCQSGVLHLALLPTRVPAEYTLVQGRGSSNPGRPCGNRRVLPGCPPG